MMIMMMMVTLVLFADYFVVFWLDPQREAAEVRYRCREHVPHPADELYQDGSECLLLLPNSAVDQIECLRF